jgi:hypothetical protein
VVSAALPLLFTVKCCRWKPWCFCGAVEMMRGNLGPTAVLAGGISVSPRPLLVLIGALGLALLRYLSWNRVLLRRGAWAGVRAGLWGGVPQTTSTQWRGLPLMPQMLDGVHQQMSVDERADWIADCTDC